MTSAATIPAIFCRNCGYNLCGLPDTRCSECGRTFDPNNRKTYAAHPRSYLRRRWGRRVATVSLTLISLAGVGVLSLWWPWHRNAAAVQMVRGYGGDTQIVGPQWLQNGLGERWVFLLERIGPGCYLANSTMTDADLALLDGQVEVQYLCVQHTRVTDAGLEHLSDLTGLTTLDLEGTRVTDAGLQHLKDLQALRTLYLGHTQITDAGLEGLKGLKGLRILDLMGTSITDAGLEHLQELKGLCTLDLSGTKVTDAGLEHLKNLKGLQTLLLRHTHISEAAESPLRRALPGCQVLR